MGGRYLLTINTGSLSLVLSSFSASTLLVYLGIIATAPFHLVHGLPINQAEIGAALAIGIGLFPAAYWHRVNLSDLPSRIAQDGRTMKQQNAGRVHDISHHGEWM